MSGMGRTYCYGIVILNVEVVIIVEEEGIVLAIVLVGHALRASCCRCFDRCAPAKNASVASRMQMYSSVLLGCTKQADTIANVPKAG